MVAILVTLFTYRNETSHGFLPCTYGGDRRKSRSKKRSWCSRRHQFHQRADAIARGLGSSQRPKPALASCRTVDAPLGESARQKLRGNKTCWTSTWNKQERHELPSPRHRKKTAPDSSRRSTTGTIIAEMQGLKGPQTSGCEEDVRKVQA